jgi:hypothetical protein
MVARDAAMDTRPPLRKRWRLPAWTGLAGGGLGLLGGSSWIALGRSLSPLPDWVATIVVMASLHGMWLHPWGAHGRARLVQGWRRVPEHWRQYVPFLIVVAVVGAALWPLPIGGMPIGQDHAYHYFATDVLVRDLLPEGRLFGWSDRFGGGRPFGDTYGTPAYLVTALAHIVSFGAVSLEASYGFGIFLVWLLGALGVGCWARRLAVTGADDASGAWLAPVVAAALFVLDPGGSRQGGWIYAMYHGVWPQLLSTGLWLIALLAWVRLVERQSVGRMAVVVLVTTFAIWSHPIGAVLTAIAAPLFFVAVACSRLLEPDTQGRLARECADPRRALPWLALALGLLAVAGMGWFARLLYASNEEYLRQVVSLWVPMRDLVLGMMRGEPFDNQWAPGAVAALVGMGIAVRRGSYLHVFALAALVAFLIVGSAEPLLAMDLGVHPGHKPMMYNRFSVAAKPFWFALAGVGVSTAVDALRHRVVRWSPPSIGLRVMSWVVLGPLVWSAWQALPGLLPTPVARPLTAQSAGIADDLRAMEHLLEREAQRLGSGPKRVVFLQKKGDQGAYELIPIANAGYGFLASRMLPAHTYRYLTGSQDAGTQRFLGASLVVTRDKLDWDETDFVARFGRHRVYRFRDPPTWPVKVDGPGEVRVRSWGPMRRELELSGTAPESRLVVGTPPYGKWSALQGGGTRALLDDTSMRGIRLSALDRIRDGPLTLQYQDTPTERRYLVTSALIVLLALGGLAAHRRLLPSLVWGRGTRVMAVGTVSVCVLSLGSAVAVGMQVGAAALEARWLHGDRGGTRITQVFHQRRPQEVTFSEEAACVQPYTRRYQTECSERDLEPVLWPSPPETAYKERGVPLDPPRPAVGIPACLRVGVPKSGHVRLSWDLPATVHELRGRIVSLERGAVRGTVRAGAAEASVSADGKRFTVAPSHKASQVELRLHAPQRTTFVCVEMVGVVRR